MVSNSSSTIDIKLGVHKSKDNELNENKVSYELKTELVCIDYKEENKNDYFDMEEVDGLSMTSKSSSSFVSTNTNLQLLPVLNFEDELFGVQDSDVSFVTAWDPLSDVDREESDDSNWDNIDPELQTLRAVSESPSDNNSGEKSPLRVLSSWNADDKSPEFIKSNVVSCCGRRWKWK
ncbi:hypothetical protein GPALN_003739 [Globodera pallida]|nr:hypothetical protein GPALN_003739 [Globodera pallida]